MQKPQHITATRLDRLIEAELRDAQRKAVEPLSYTIESAIRATGLGRSTLYSAINSGVLTRVKVGRRTLIPAASLRALIGEVA